MLAHTHPESAASHVDTLFERARSGDDDAWNELFQVCYPKVIRVVRRKLDRPMRSLYDSTDFASDVMKSLAANADRLDFPSLKSLLAFLTKVAEEKVIDSYRKAHTRKRDIGRDCDMSWAADEDDDRGGLASDEPTPSQVALGHEAHDILLADASSMERLAIELKRDGYTLPEISQRTGWHLRSLQRFFKGLWDHYHRD